MREATMQATMQTANGGDHDRLSLPTGSQNQDGTTIGARPIDRAPGITVLVGLKQDDQQDDDQKKRAQAYVHVVTSSGLAYPWSQEEKRAKVSPESWPC
jgi:hypothetical protein